MTMFSKRVFERNKMDLKNIKKNRIELESKLSKLIDIFQGDTGTIIEKIDISKVKIETTESLDYLTNVSLSLKIPKG